VPSTDQDVHLKDGRVLRVRDDAVPNGLPVFVLHGTPGSRWLYPKHVQHALRHGLRLIGHDRPGYGWSTPRRGRRIVDEASDVVAIADSLGIDRFAVWGHSGGGAHALACAAVLPQRVVAVASLAAVAPFPAQGLDWFEGMGEQNVADFQLMIQDPLVWEAKNHARGEAIRTSTEEELIRGVSTLLSATDRAAFTLDLAKFFQAQMREGLRSGSDGFRDDNLAEGKPWGFDLTAIRIPVQIWHGEHDRFVPLAHGAWLASHVPGAEPHLQPKEGHITLFDRGVLSAQEWLASRLRQA
jgi:pimeloyl-ACP methyl ester carboxylesterase